MTEQPNNPENYETPEEYARLQEVPVEVVEQMLSTRDLHGLMLNHTLLVHASARSREVIEAYKRRHDNDGTGDTS